MPRLQIGAGRISSPFARKEHDHVVGDRLAQSPAVRRQRGRERRGKIVASAERERAALRRARIDFDEVGGAITVADEIDPVKSREPEEPRNCSRRRVDLGAVDTPDDVGRSDHAVGHQNVVIDRPDDIAFPGGEGAGCRHPRNEALNADGLRSRIEPCEQMMNVAALHGTRDASDQAGRVRQTSVGGPRLVEVAHDRNAFASPASVGLENCRKSDPFKTRRQLRFVAHGQSFGDAHARSAQFRH